MKACHTTTLAPIFSVGDGFSAASKSPPLGSSATCSSSLTGLSFSLD